MIAYLLLALGLLFVWLEFYLPGGAFAVAAAIFILAALVSYFTASTSVIASTLFFVVTVLAVMGVIWFAIKRIKKSAKHNTFFLSRDQEGYTSSDLTEAITGKRGVTLTECGPSGYALIEGKRYPIICRGPYLNKGVEVEVIANELGNYVVKPLR
jgi:membrane-bound serine protease (ClpP class)